MKKKIGIFTIIWFLLMGLAGCGSEKKAENTVTVSIRCDTAVEKGLCEEEKWKGVLPEDGCIFPETEIVTANGDTVFDVLCRIRDEYGIHMEYSGGKDSAYIEGIGNLYERDGGRWSGWMYSVNGTYPGVTCSEYELQDQDRVEWNYTCDLGMDLKSDMEGSKEWKETHE